MKADIGAIFSDHFRTLRSNQSGNLLWYDLVLFYGIPIVPALYALKYDWKVTAVDNILASLALMAGLLFNLLILIFDTAVRIKDSTGDFARHRRKLVRELQSNVTYALLVAIVSSTLLGGISLAGLMKAGLPWSPMVLAILAHFVLTLLLILKRVRRLFLHELPDTAY